MLTEGEREDLTRRLALAESDRDALQAEVKELRALVTETRGVLLRAMTRMVDEEADRPSGRR